MLVVGIIIIVIMIHFIFWKMQSGTISFTPRLGIFDMLVILELSTGVVLTLNYFFE